MKKSTLKQIQELLIRAEDLLIKAGEGLIEDEVGDQFEDDFHEILSSNLEELDEISQLEFKKYFATKLTRWKKVSHSVYRFKEIRQGIRLIEPRKKLLEDILKRNLLYIPRGGHIKAGTPFSARELLRGYILSARSKVTIVDSYLYPDMLVLLDEVLQEKSDLKFHLLTSIKNNKNSGLKRAIGLFSEQYPKAIEEAKIGDIQHDRYLILDDSRVIHFGASFHGLGQKGSSYTEKTDEKEIMQTVTAIKEDFRNARDLV